MHTCGFLQVFSKQLNVYLRMLSKFRGQGDALGSVESVKAASSVYAPVDCEIVEINESLEDNHALVNESAEGEGWMVKLKATSPDQLSGLMDADAYAAFCNEE